MEQHHLSPSRCAWDPSGKPQARGLTGMSDTITKISELLIEAAETHHQVYRITDGNYEPFPWGRRLAPAPAPGKLGGCFDSAETGAQAAA